MSFITPWLATFGFGCAVFLVGKYLQRGERIKRLEEVIKAKASAAAVRENLVLVKGIIPRGQGSTGSTGLSETFGGGPGSGRGPEARPNQGYDA
jgi:hypothetical protein